MDAHGLWARRCTCARANFFLCIWTVLVGADIYIACKCAFCFGVRLHYVSDLTSFPADDREVFDWRGFEPPEEGEPCQPRLL